MVKEYNDVDELKKNSMNEEDYSEDDIADLDDDSTDEQPTMAMSLKIEGLEKKISELTAQLDSANDKAMRMAAEADNTRKRSQKDVDNARQYGIEKFAKEMVAVMDNFELGLQAASSLTEEQAKNFAEGMSMTYSMMLSILERFNVIKESPEGGKFDAKKHEAISMQESADHEPGTIIKVLQPGFIMIDRVLRPARVIIAKKAVEPAEDENES